MAEISTGILELWGMRSADLDLRVWLIHLWALNPNRRFRLFSWQRFLGLNWLDYHFRLLLFHRSSLQKILALLVGILFDRKLRRVDTSCLKFRWWLPDSLLRRLDTRGRSINLLSFPFVLLHELWHNLLAFNWKVRSFINFSYSKIISFQELPVLVFAGPEVVLIAVNRNAESWSGCHTQATSRFHISGAGDGCRWFLSFDVFARRVSLSHHLVIRHSVVGLLNFQIRVVHMPLGSTSQQSLVFVLLYLDQRRWILPVSVCWLDGPTPVKRVIYACVVIFTFEWLIHLIL